jgi:hypothetical protein
MFGECKTIQMVQMSGHGGKVHVVWKPNKNRALRKCTRKFVENIKIDLKEMYLIMRMEFNYVRMGNDDSCELRGLLCR